MEYEIEMEYETEYGMEMEYETERYRRKDATRRRKSIICCVRCRRIEGGRGHIDTKKAFLKGSERRLLERRRREKRTPSADEAERRRRDDGAAGRKERFAIGEERFSA